MLKKIIAILTLTSSFATLAAENVVLITIDGVRWQEVFHGAQLILIEDKKVVARPQQLKDDFWHSDLKKRREKLMPFFWQSVVKQGAVIGNRDQNSKMSVVNKFHFSYPGYSEILTGIADPDIDSNDKFNNPNVTFLEWLNHQSKYKDRVAAFASWDVFPYIINTKRSKVMVNAGFDKSIENDSYSQLLNQLQDEIPSPWHNVRLDAFTYRFAKHNLQINKPKVTYVAFGETDDFAHDGHYDQYLYALKRTDNYLKDLWQTIQSIPGYKDNTVMLIVTDHGRGATAGDWRHHGAKDTIGSEQIWLAAIGPGIKSAGIVSTSYEVKQNQVASTLLTLLGEQPIQFNSAAGKPIDVILNKSKVL